MESSKFLDFLSDKSAFPIILDGAMGTELERRGLTLNSQFWSATAIIDAPEIVYQIHKDYLSAGAKIITTNTFRTTPYIFQKAGLTKIEAFQTLSRAILLAVQAKKAINNQSFIAGSIAPLEDCFRPDLVLSNDLLFENHKEVITYLDQQTEVDLILFETMNSLREVEVLLELSSRVNHPVIMSVTLNKKGELLDGTPWDKVINSVKDSNLVAFGVNCAAPPVITTALKILRRLNFDQFPLIAYANIGFRDPLTGEENNFPATTGSYILEAKKWTVLGAKIVGGCCGTTPEYIQALNQSIR